MLESLGIQIESDEQINRFLSKIAKEKGIVGLDEMGLKEVKWLILNTHTSSLSGNYNRPHERFQIVSFEKFYKTIMEFNVERTIMVGKYEAKVVGDNLHIGCQVLEKTYVNKVVNRINLGKLSIGGNRLSFHFNNKTITYKDITIPFDDVLELQRRMK